MSMDSQVAVIAFASNGTENSDAIVVVNWGDEDKKISVKISGTYSDSFAAFMTTEGDRNDEGELIGNGKNYVDFGNYKVVSGVLVFEAPKGSVTTFFGEQ
jgi:hypothetical protein